MKLRVGIVGSSWWTEAMYLPALADHEAATVEAICGLRRAPAASVASRWGIRQVFDSAEQMLTSGEIDAVVAQDPNQEIYVCEVWHILERQPVRCQQTGNEQWQSGVLGA